MSDQTKHFTHHLQKFIDEWEEKYPGLGNMIEAILKANSVSNMEIDYAIERTWAVHKAAAEGIEKIISKQ